jgi:hypothetical protein
MFGLLPQVMTPYMFGLLPQGNVVIRWYEFERTSYRFEA